jgi:hypothetical protein
MSRIQKNNTSFLTITSVLVSDTWRDLSTGLSGYGNALVTDMSNNLYAGGIFTNAGGVSVNRVAMWNGASWVALGNSTLKGVNLSSDPINSIVSTLILDNSRNLYVGGYFDQVGLPVEANNVAKWNGAEWNRLSVSDSGVNNRVYALAFDNNNNFIVGRYNVNQNGQYVYKYYTLLKIQHDTSPYQDVINQMLNAQTSFCPNITLQSNITYKLYTYKT